jgi:hypothetical protein
MTPTRPTTEPQTAAHGVSATAETAPTPCCGNPTNLDPIRRRVERWTAGDDDADIWQIAEDRSDLIDEVDRLTGVVAELRDANERWVQENADLDHVVSTMIRTLRERKFVT